MSYETLAFCWKLPPSLVFEELPPSYRRESLLPPSARTSLSVDEAIWTEVPFDELTRNGSAALEGNTSSIEYQVRDSNDLIVKLPQPWIEGPYPGMESKLWLVAFVVNAKARAYLEGLARGGLHYHLGVTPLHDLVTHSWRSVGWDVADQMLYSGLANTSYSAAEQHEFQRDFGMRLNGVGLFDDETLAEQFVVVCNRRIPDHAPFFPVAIWCHPLCPS